MLASKPTGMIPQCFYQEKDRMTHNSFQEKMKSTITKWNDGAGCGPHRAEQVWKCAVNFLSQSPLNFHMSDYPDRLFIYFHLMRRASGWPCRRGQRWEPLTVWPEDQSAPLLCERCARTHLGSYDGLLFLSTLLPAVPTHTHTHTSACQDWIQHLLVLFAPSGGGECPLGTQWLCVDGGHSWPRPNKIKNGTVERNSPPIPFDYQSILSSVPFSLPPIPHFFSPHFSVTPFELLWRHSESITHLIVSNEVALHPLSRLKHEAWFFCYGFTEKWEELLSFLAF